MTRAGAGGGACMQQATKARRVTQIRTRLRVIASRRLALCASTSRDACAAMSALDDERERLLAELAKLDRRAYREIAL